MTLLSGMTEGKRGGWPSYAQLRRKQRSQFRFLRACSPTPSLCGNGVEVNTFVRKATATFLLFFFLSSLSVSSKVPDFFFTYSLLRPPQTPPHPSIPTTNTAQWSHSSAIPARKPSRSQNWSSTSTAAPMLASPALTAPSPSRGLSTVPTLLASVRPRNTRRLYTVDPRRVVIRTTETVKRTITKRTTIKSRTTRLEQKRIPRRSHLHLHSLSPLSPPLLLMR